MNSIIIFCFIQNGVPTPWTIEILIPKIMIKCNRFRCIRSLIFITNVFRLIKLTISLIEEQEFVRYLRMFCSQKYYVFLRWNYNGERERQDGCRDDDDFSVWLACVRMSAFGAACRILTTDVIVRVKCLNLVAVVFLKNSSWQCKIFYLSTGCHILV